jgi:ABC-type transporter Mla MlaB component
VKTLDLASLALLLTAQRQAQEEDRIVWLAGVPAQIWRALEAMGLNRFFKAFPVSAEVAV